MQSNDVQNRLSLTAEVVSAFVSNNPVPAGELPDLISSVYASLAKLDQAVPTPEVQTPAVPIKKSVTRDWIISLEDGKKFKSLKRHLATKYGMTPEEYRSKWNLPSDYPMVAPSYAEARSELAKKLGLGRKAPTKRGRRKAA